MADEDKGIVKRVIEAVSGLLPDGGIDDEGPAPDVDGRRDTDQVHRQAVLKAKTQQPPNASTMTSYEPVDRGRLNDA